MTYTLWSRGRLLGHSALDHQRVPPRHRVGTLVPTELGTRLLPVATEVSARMMAYGRALKRKGRDSSRCSSEHCVPEYVDYVSAIDEAAALALELRGPDGQCVPTEWIDVSDTVFLSSLEDDEPAPAEGDDPDAGANFAIDDYLDVELDDERDDGWDPFGDPEDDAELPDARFQLHVMLLDDASVP